MALTKFPGENNLSFIETSALDASNVELAFQNILTGTCVFCFRDLPADVTQKSTVSSQARHWTTTKVHNQVSAQAQRSILLQLKVKTTRRATVVKTLSQMIRAR